MVCTGVDEKVVHDFSSRHIWVGEFTVGLKMYEGVDWIRLAQVMVELNAWPVVQKGFGF
jgi:hypothetical protein